MDVATGVVFDAVDPEAPIRHKQVVLKACGDGKYVCASLDRICRGCGAGRKSVGSVPGGLFCDVNGERELVDGRRMKKKRKYGGCERVSRIDLIPEEYERVRGAEGCGGNVHFYGRSGDKAFFA